MEAKTLAEYIANDRTRIIEQKQQCQQQMRDIEEKIAKLDREMVAVLQYERTVAGHKSVAGNRRAQILKLVRGQPGIRRKAICAALGIDVKSNKAQNVSLTLTKLVQDGEIHRNESRAYYPVGNATEE